jgi:Bifunctional DNA primase/polymerase, N-terminal
MRRRIRADDTRSDEFLADTGRRAHELDLASGWTSGLIGEKAKRASDRGTFAWKKARRLPGADFAAGLYVEQCRTRNPVVTASGSGLVLLEVDGEPELLDRFGLVLPETVKVASRRGQHHYFRPPEGRPPLKVQVSADGVVVSSDGYLIGAGALHESGHVYRYVSDPDVGIATLAAETYERILELGGEVRENVRRTLEAGQPLVEGLRRDTSRSRSSSRIAASTRTSSPTACSSSTDAAARPRCGRRRSRRRCEARSCGRSGARRSSTSCTGARSRRSPRSTRRPPGALLGGRRASTRRRSSSCAKCSPKGRGRPPRSRTRGAGAGSRVRQSNGPRASSECAPRASVRRAGEAVGSRTGTPRSFGPTVRKSVGSKRSPQRLPFL